MSDQRDFTAGLVGLTTPETRIRLGELLAACRTRSAEIGGFQGQGLLEQVSASEMKLRLAAQDQIRHLAECLRTYGTPLPDEAAAPVPEAPAAPPEPAPAPEPVAAALPPTRPVLPVRPGIRLPPIAPKVRT